MGLSLLPAPHLIQFGLNPGLHPPDQLPVRLHELPLRLQLRHDFALDGEGWEGDWQFAEESVLQAVDRSTSLCTACKNITFKTTQHVKEPFRIAELFIYDYGVDVLIKRNFVSRNANGKSVSKDAGTDDAENCACPLQ